MKSYNFKKHLIDPVNSVMMKYLQVEIKTAFFSFEKQPIEKYSYTHITLFFWIFWSQLYKVLFWYSTMFSFSIGDVILWEYYHKIGNQNINMMIDDVMLYHDWFC